VTVSFFVLSFRAAQPAPSLSGISRQKGRHIMENIATINHLIPVYLVYGTASVGLTVWLARTLFKSGEVFLEDVFADNPRMAAAVNRLLVVGFYLLNLGYALVTLKAGHQVANGTEAIETLAMKLGSLLLALGAIHMGNMYLFHRIRRRAQIRLAPPPVRPQMQHNAAGAYEPLRP
jgi:hypothetical protein